MKLLQIIPTTRRGGVEAYSLTIAKAALERSWQVHLGFPSAAGTQSLIEDAGSLGIHYHRLQIGEVEIPGFDSISRQHQALLPILKQLLVPRLWFDLSKIPYFFRTLVLLRRVRPDVVMINLPWPDYGMASILACGYLKIPTLLVFQLAPQPVTISSWKRRLYHWAHRRQQKWIGVSQRNCEHICQSFALSIEKVSCVYNGASIKIEADRDKIDIRNKVRAELGLKEESILALTVAQLNEQKGHDFLIPVIPHLKNEYPDLKFIWAGDGDQKATLQDLLREYDCANQVLMLGYRSDIPRLLQAADLFIFPTHYEGQPFALLEAMAYGVPVIATATDGIPEVIEHGTHGLLTRKGDSCDLLETIRWALRHKEDMSRMAEQGKWRVKGFSQEKMTHKTFDMLQQFGPKNLSSK